MLFVTTFTVFVGVFDGRVRDFRLLFRVFRVVRILLRRRVGVRLKDWQVRNWFIVCNPWLSYFSPANVLLEGGFSEVKVAAELWHDQWV